MPEVEHGHSEELDVSPEEALTDQRVRLDDVEKLRLESIGLAKEEDNVLRIGLVFLASVDLTRGDPLDMLREAKADGVASVLTDAVVKFKYFHRFARLLGGWLLESLLAVVDILISFKQDFE